MMRLFTRRRIVFISTVLLVSAGLAYYYWRTRPEAKVGKPLLTAEQKTALRKAFPASADALSPASPEADKLRELAKDANVVICIIDAARADHFGAYGYQRDTTPNFDGIAKESYVFDHHFCQYPSTLPSTAGLFSSQYPDTNGIPHLASDNEDEDETVQPEPPFTFPLGLEAVGFKSALFSANPHASPIYGIGLGFGEGYYGPKLKPFTQKGEEHFAPAILLRALDSWLEQNREARSFIYLHFIPPHVPYEQPEEYTEHFRDKTPPDFAAANYSLNKFLFPIKVKEHKREIPPLPEWINLYDANLRYGDWAIGEVKKLLEKHRLYDKTLLILTSDHGDGFGEHGFPWHHGGIYNEVTHIPLVMRLPGGGAGGKNINALTQTIDLLPTVYDLVQAPFPGGEVQGKSLLPLMTGQQTKVHDYSFTRSDHPAKYIVRDMRRSFLLYTNPQWQALYDTESDPGCRKNIITKQPQEADKLHKVFLQFAEEQRYPPVEFPGVTAKASVKRASGKKAKLSPEVEREMKALGYLK